jgi:hypothetical protein
MITYKDDDYEDDDYKDEDYEDDDYKDDDYEDDDYEDDDYEDDDDVAGVCDAGPQTGPLLLQSILPRHVQW